jgi:putative ABC transport system ATP-binding protein
VNPLEASGLHRFYRRGGTEVAALLDVSLSCEAGETLAVTGPSGSGKSTLLSLLAGLDDPDGGGVLVGGEQISHLSPGRAARLRARRIGVLTQSSGLFGHLSVLDNVRFAASLRERGPDPGRGRGAGNGSESQRTPGPGPEELIDGLGLTAVRAAFARTLSGGESARAGLAVALAGACVLLADEPTAEVSAGEERTILDLLHQWRPQHGATVIVTHADAVARRADRVLHLIDGRVR